MKTTKYILLISALFTMACTDGFASSSYPVEPIIREIRQDATTRSLSRLSTEHHSFFAGNSPIAGIGYFNFHGRNGSTGTAHFLDRLSVKAGAINTYHHFLACPYSKGIAVCAHIKYSALLSVACVWDIAWGLKGTCPTGQRVSYANNMNIVLVLSNPVSNGKGTNAFIHKLDANIPLSMLSIVEVVITFAHI